jgi:hypothetical protein
MSNEIKNAPIACQSGQLAAMARWGEALETAAGHFSVALSRKRYVVLVLFSIAYAFETCYFASRKLFWYDELYTIYISRLPDFASIWHALLAGVDFNPPLLYELTRLSELLLGEGTVAARLPAIVGFGVFCLCLFRFVSIKSSALGGFVSMLFPLVTGGYAYEARSYGTVLGFGGVALICWQAAASQTERRLCWLAGLAAALGCAMLTHSYAVLLFLPIVFGELARSVSLRRVDWPVWAAIIIASAAMLPSFILLRSVVSALSNVGTVVFFEASVPKLADAYKSYLAPAAVVLFGALVFMLAAQTSRPSTLTQPIYVGRHRLYEFVALFAFVLVPVFAYLAAKLTGAPFMSRYGISSIAGFAGLLGIAVARRHAIAIGVLLVLVAQIGISFIQFVRSPYILEPTTSYELSTYAPNFLRRYAMMTSVPDKNSPIVLLDDLEFLPTFYYAPESLASRLTYLVQSKDNNGLLYLKLRKCCNAAGNGFYVADFLSSHDRFLVFGGLRSLERLNYLIDAGAIVMIERIHNDDFLFSVKITNKKTLVP